MGYYYYYYYYYYYFVYVLQVFLLLVVARGLLPSSSSSSVNLISDEVFKDERATGRNLLQTIRECPMNMERVNYTILTSKCKGPQFPPKECCAAFGDLACPFADLVNDPSNDCSSSLFYYIDQLKLYPRGLFSSECRQNIPCPAASPTSSHAADASAAAADDDVLHVIAQSYILVFMLLFLGWMHKSLF